MSATNTKQFHKTWLIVTAIVVGSFGPIFSLATRQSLSFPARWTLNLLNGPGGGAANFDANTPRFLTALTGGFLLGWGVMIVCLRAWVYDDAAEGVRRVVVTSLVSWFLLDSIGSISSGNGWNAASNVVVLLTAVGPLWFPAQR
jgi:hypothetical protein